MKVAFPYPGYWPYVRRGIERCTHDLATFLAERGHEVHVITSTPGRPRTEWDGKVKVSYVRQLNHPLLFKYAALFRLNVFALDACRVMKKERPDVAHLWAFSGIRMAPIWSRAFHVPYVFQMSVYWPRGLGGQWFPEIRGARQAIALNSHMADAVEDEFKMPCTVMPPPVDMRTFRPCADRDLHNPIVLYPADLADPRKGGTLLLRAWNRVYRECPAARLVLAGSLGVAGWLQDQAGQSMLSNLDLVTDPRARAAIELRGPGGANSLPALYSKACVTVLPSVDEAFGMVVTESLACGTPVVASAYGGPGEILTQPGVGVTVDLRTPSDLTSGKRADELADAILRAMELSREKATAARCRDWASQWGLDRIGLEEEHLLQDVIAGGGSVSHRRPQLAERVLGVGA